MAKIERTGPQLRSKYPKSAPVPRVRSVPDPLGKVAHFILFYSAIKNFTLPPYRFQTFLIWVHETQLKRFQSTQIHEAIAFGAPAVHGCF